MRKLFGFILTILLAWLDQVRSVAPNIDVSHNMRILKLPKTVKPGSLIYRLKGSHPDAIPLTFGVRGSVGRKLLDIRSADFRSADVFLKSPLQENEYNLTIFVTDNNETTEVDSTIMSTNPEGPLESPFLEVHSIYFVTENSPHNTTIGFVSARDKESSNLPVMFELRGSDNFAIRYLFGPKGTSRAMISLVKDVDYERRNIYPMTIIATNAWSNETIDTRNVASIDILIVVRDAEDTPPRFVDLPSVVQISEDTESGNQIKVIKAEDGDVEINRNISYSLVKSPLTDYFLINKTSGELSLKISGMELKRIIGLNNPFILEINATENVPDEEFEPDLPISTKGSIAFVVVAFENRSPSFASNSLSGYIEENSPIMTAIRWYNYSSPQVTDPDSGLNGTMDLTLSSTQLTDNLFTVQPNWGLKDISFSILLNNSNGLDYEQGPNQINLKLIVVDRSPINQLSSEIMVNIDVIDVNDNYPQFSQLVYDASLYENAEPGTKLIQIEATDRDSGIFGQIKYTSINGPIARNFLLDRDSGLITLTTIEGIDREKISEYTLTVEARDQAGYGLSNVTQIRIKILDANDNDPQFVQSRYDAVLNPDGLTFTQPLSVKSIDLDEPGTVNSQVNYEIIDGNYQGKFSINNETGLITITSPLTFDRTSKTLNDPFQTNPFRTIVLTVRAHDRGIPYRFSTVKVFIHHKDFLNRTVSFILPQDEAHFYSNREGIERGLTKLTGADVHVYSIKPSSLGPSSSQIDAWIAYPIHAIVDLRDLNLISSDLGSPMIGRQPQPGPHEPAIQTASIYRSDYELILWVLLILIFITLLFLIVLLAVWCLCYRAERKTKTILESVNLSNREVTMKSNFKDQSDHNGTVISKSVAKNTSSNGKMAATDVLKSTRSKSLVSGDDAATSSDSRKRGADHDKQSKFKRIRLGRHQRARVGPEIIGNVEPIYLDELENDSDFYIMRRSRLVRAIPREDLSSELQEMPNSEPGTYVIDESGHNYYLFSRRGDGIIRRPPIPTGLTTRGSTQIRRGGSLRSQSPCLEVADNFRSVSEAEIRDLKLEDVEDVVGVINGAGKHDTQQTVPKSNLSDEEYIPRRSIQPQPSPTQSTQSNNKNEANDVKTVLDSSQQSSNPLTGSIKNSKTSSTSSSASNKSNRSNQSYRSNQSRPENTILTADDLPGSVNTDESMVRLDRSPSQSSNIDMNLIDGVVIQSGGVNSGHQSIVSVPITPNGIGRSNDEPINGVENTQQVDQQESSNFNGFSTDKITKSSNETVIHINGGSTMTMLSEPNENFDHSDKSDSDSGIGRVRLEKKMNLKNSDLMTKKSIFTIVYDEVKTDRINSADSVLSTV